MEFASDHLAGAMSKPTFRYTKILNSTLVVVGLGYFVDSFDLFLYSALRTPSLSDLGLAGDDLTRTGIWIFNLQIIGMLLGGFLWGVAGDRMGRKKALLGSVLLYSIGSLSCAFVHGIWTYAGMRFITGIGLAGEMGLGAVLVAETLSNARKDWGLVAYYILGNVGIIFASTLASHVPWRWCYALGGIIGLSLLLARMILLESGLYKAISRSEIPRGSLSLLLKRPALLQRYLCCIFCLTPFLYIANFLITLAPEFGKAVGATVPVKANIALACYFGAASFGAVIATAVSHLLKRRLATIALFMAANLGLIAYYLTQTAPSGKAFYGLCAVMGLANCVVLMIFAAVEQFGTNMRATAGTSALSTGRAAFVLVNLLFLNLRAHGLEITMAAGWVALTVFGIGFVCLTGLQETYRREMDFLEM